MAMGDMILRACIGIGILLLCFTVFFRYS